MEKNKIDVKLNSERLLTNYQVDGFDPNALLVKILNHNS
jgi:hypothetical protein